MQDDATQAGPNDGSDSPDEGTRADSSNSTNQPPDENDTRYDGIEEAEIIDFRKEQAGAEARTEALNGTGHPTQQQQERTLIDAFGECTRRSRVGKRPLCHCWHGTGLPIRTPSSEVLNRVCCYCAPEGIGIVVRAALTEEQIRVEGLRHGPRLVFERVEIRHRPSLIMPGDPQMDNLPPDFRG